MDPKLLFCLPQGDELFNPLNTLFIQMGCILVFSQLFYLMLKPCGQAAPVAQILAGIVLSPVLLSRIPKVKEFFLQKDAADYYSFFSFSPQPRLGLYTHPFAPYQRGLLNAFHDSFRYLVKHVISCRPPFNC
ncbi:BnaC02g46680D [Brassica napus]|uniref:BnaA02g36170D protein n=1 Tax=Brassica napus TaxID=3708 RepID=A0A078J8B3_BRANA|nr:BnaA02g36170D [Brassica napus]CDY61614.1 BnaC02g46680D [Brassica napus]